MKLGDMSLWLAGISRTARGLAVLNKRELRQQLRETQGQRDALLAACEALMSCFVVRNDGPNTWDMLAVSKAYQMARAAIASVKQDD